MDAESTVHSLLKPLDKKFNIVDRLPTANQYASYEAVLELFALPSGENIKERVQNFLNDFKKFGVNCLEGDFYFQTSLENKHLPCDQVRVILHFHDDLLRVYDHYHNIIVSVTGPLDEEHMHFLKSKNHSVDCSNKLYYNKYACRLTVSVNRNISAFDSIAYLDDIEDLVKVNVDQYRRYRAAPYYGPRECHYYLDTSSANTLIPLITLSSGGAVSYRITLRKVPLLADTPVQLELFPDK